MSDDAEPSPNSLPESAGAHSDRLTGSELLVRRTVLGMSRSELGRALSVKENTVRRWESGKDPIPVSIRAEVAAMENAADHAVNSLIESLMSMPSPRVVLEKEHGPVGQDRDDLKVYGAGWWHAVVGRAMREIPGTRVGTVEEFAESGAE